MENWEYFNIHTSISESDIFCYDTLFRIVKDWKILCEKKNKDFKVEDIENEVEKFLYEMSTSLSFYLEEILEDLEDN